MQVGFFVVVLDTFLILAPCSYFIVTTSSLMSGRMIIIIIITYFPYIVFSMMHFSGVFWFCCVWFWLDGFALCLFFHTRISSDLCLLIREGMERALEVLCAWVGLSVRVTGLGISFGYLCRE